MLNSLSENQFKQLAKFLSYPRGMSINDQESYNTMLRARKINQMMREIGKNNLDLFGMDLNNIKNFFASSLSNNSGRYLKTSSLIITYNDLLTTGGHNLSSKISRVNSMTHYKQSKGNYVPKDYERPEYTEPEVADNKPVSSQPAVGGTPSGGNPTTTKPTSGTNPNSGGDPSGSKPSTPTASRPSGSNPNSRSSGSTPSGNKPSNSSSSGGSTAQSGSSSRSSSASNIRPRSAVISTAPRTTRGF